MDIYLKDFEDNKDAVLAVNMALKCCNDGDRLVFENKEYVFKNTYAEGKNYYFPRYTDKTKYYAIYLENKKDIVIDGNGATLMCNGDISPFGIENCENIKIINFKIDYTNPTFWQGLITESGDNYFDVEYDNVNFPVFYDEQKREMTFGDAENADLWRGNGFLANEFDKDEKRMAEKSPDYFLCLDKPHEVYSFMSVLVDTEILSENKIRFNIKKAVNDACLPKHRVGKMLVFADHERRNCNFYIYKSKDVFIGNVDMYSSCSFGIICLLCENIEIDNVNSVIKPKSDRMLAVSADVFHCVNCKGQIKAVNCTFENMKDDAVNVHSLFTKFRKKLSKNTAIMYIDYLAKRALNLYSEGERVYFVDGKTFKKIRKDCYTVKKSEFIGQYHLMVEFCEDISEIPEDCFMESLDNKPDLYIGNCKTGNGRGRGFIVNCGGKTVVENCVFYTHSNAIGIGGASTVYAEGTSVNDLTIRNNDFSRAGYLDKGMATIIAKPSGIIGENKNYHHNIVIENNKFPVDKECVINLSNCSNCEIRGNNILLKDKTLLFNCDDDSIVID